MNYNNGYFIIFITLLHYLSVSFQVTNANREGKLSNYKGMITNLIITNI